MSANSLRVQLSDPNGFNKYPKLQISRWRDTSDIRAWGAIGDGYKLCDESFKNAELTESIIYVPKGIWRLSSPMIIGDRVKFFGPGVLKFDNAEWWRRGGSSGSLDVDERYTLFYNFSSKEDVTLKYDGKVVDFSWIDERTILAAGTRKDTNVVISIKNGTLTLGCVAESIRTFNVFGNGNNGDEIMPELLKISDMPKGYDNTSFGARALMSVVKGGNNTAFGSKSLLSNVNGNNNTAIGFQALYRSLGDANTAYGSISGEWLNKGSYNSFFGAGSGKKLQNGNSNVAIGFESLGESLSSSYVVAIGYRANANTGDKSQSNSIYIGAFSGDYNLGSNNTFVGYRAGNSLNAAENEKGGTGHDNVGVGMFSLRRNMSGSENAVVGAGACAESSNVSATVAVGFNALGSTTANSKCSVAIGHSSLKNTSGNFNVGIGYQSLAKNTKGYKNVAIGTWALSSNLTGKFNSALGINSGCITQLGRNAIDLNNTTLLGYNCRASGNNQVQLGNSRSTTYVYGTVHNRADLRDKADLRDTVLGIEFILGLRAVDGRWDLRDDYVQIDDRNNNDNGGDISHSTHSGNLSEHKNTNFQSLRPDGTYKQPRYHHWFIAQEVKKLCESLNIEFGGLQHHALNGGDDIYTLGYDEFIPPIVKSIQSCWYRLDEIEKRLEIIENKER
ncbi:tail fiber domain-containing protein [Yokenella regensburgei]|uniref:hypothetical protein n=1 Tax=Yokenella regensburgei TaxID=158877 RepID=UPI003F191727